MSTNTNLLNNKVIDNQTGRSVHATALSNFELAGWENFQDSLYTPLNKLTLLEDVAQKVTFNTPLLFTNFERQPQIGVTKYPIWDTTFQRVNSYKENIFGNCSIRLQFVAEATSNSNGVAIEVSLTIPNYLTIYRDAKPLVKGKTPQRVVNNIDFYLDQNSIDNGVEIYLTAVGDDVNIYNQSIYLKNF